MNTFHDRDMSFHLPTTFDNLFPSQQIGLVFPLSHDLTILYKSLCIYHLIVLCHTRKKDMSQAVNVRRLKGIFVTEAAFWSAHRLRAKPRLTTNMATSGLKE